MVDFVKSTNFFVKDSLLVGNPDKIVKGSEIDTEFNNIATAVSSKANYASPNLTGLPTAPTAPQGTNTSQIATTAFVFANSVPVGAIILWSGSIGTIPSGYSLCDGSNGTPNLRDKFIVGAGTAYAVGALGGSKDAVAVSHTHTATSTVTDPGHKHNSNVFTVDGGGDVNVVGIYPAGLTNQDVGINNATTGISVSTAINSVGESGTDKNLPPYYALAYIMRVA
jgi:hypothetical protein